MTRFALATLTTASILGVVAAGGAAASPLKPAQPLVESAIEQVQYWRGERRRWDRPRSCRAVGLTINGRQIPGVFGRGFGGDACREAMAECRFELRQRQRFGANPFGRCEVIG